MLIYRLIQIIVFYEIRQYFFLAYSVLKYQINYVLVELSNQYFPLYKNCKYAYYTIKTQESDVNKPNTYILFQRS